LDIFHIFSPQKSNFPPKTTSLEKNPALVLRPSYRIGYNLQCSFMDYTLTYFRCFLRHWDCIRLPQPPWGRLQKVWYSVAMRSLKARQST